MIRWMSVARISAGKGIAAVAFAKEMAEFAKKYKGAPPVHVYADSFGEVGTIRWCADYNDLAALEKVGDEVMADEAYLKKMEEATDLFVEGSHRTVIMRGI